MKLTSLALALKEATNFAPFPVIDVLIAAFAAISVRGKYISTSEDINNSTVADVRAMLWGINPAYPADQATMGSIKAAMSDPAVRNQAQEALDWFTSLPINVRQQNDFYSKINNVLQSPTVTDRQAGFVAALATAYLRSDAATTKQLKATADPNVKLAADPTLWNQEWGEVEVLYKQNVKILDVNRVQTKDGDTILRIRFQTPSGYIATWFAALDTDVERGDTLNVTGFLEPSTPKGSDRHGIRFTPDPRWRRAFRRSKTKNGPNA